MPVIRKTVEVDNIPEIGDPDRKRALNILAQRRYRHRQREKLRILGQKTTCSVASHVSVEHNPSGLPSKSMQESFAASTLPQTLHSSSIALWNERSYTPIPDLDIAPYNISPGFSVPNLDTVALPNDFESSGLFDIDFLSLSDTNPMTEMENEELRSELPTLEVSQFTFPDESQLEIPAIKLIRVTTTMAEMLGCADSLWDPTACRILDVGQLPGSGMFLPTNLVPTEAQTRVPHHPALDILPWPSVRTKLVCLFAQPSQRRPPIARGPMPIMQLVHDIDDDAEGFRISGSEGGDADAFDGDNWEVGQTFYRNWWWALDPDVILKSNALRRRRGASQLRLMPA